MTSRAAGLAALASAALLGGCYDFGSQVSAIPDAVQLTEPPIALGRWCNADVDIDDAGAVTGAHVDDCFELTFDDKSFELVATPPDPEETMRLAMAPLTRGAILMQTLADDMDVPYMLLAAMPADGALVILPELTATPLVVALAEGAEVTLALEDYDADDPPVITVLEGTPEAVHEVIAEAAGLAFDAGLRDEALGRDLMNGLAFYVRYDGEPDAMSDADEAAVVARVEAARERIMRAMILE